MKDKIVSKLKSYGFWMSLVSAVFVFLNTLGMKMDIPYPRRCRHYFPPERRRRRGRLGYGRNIERARFGSVRYRGSHSRL